MEYPDVAGTRRRRHSPPKEDHPHSFINVFIKCLMQWYCRKFSVRNELFGVRLMKPHTITDDGEDVYTKKGRGIRHGIAMKLTVTTDT